jgi:iron complex transport system substrate-binding protein
VHQQGRDLFLGFDMYAGALSFSSILSLPLLLNEVVPAMSAAIDGNPETKAALK